ncbi:endonuclease III domain-containing protein [Lacticaseibacillus parakribbianus]|uniref:endonuclease III domain-containing protein n=1 Tax=Lacticaseibacillus parakribbianus TaxID=2970927 RepID=UPI0021CB94A3|nr:endonuclease III [Lacticaseibacillus parakribbianus]
MDDKRAVKLLNLVLALYPGVPPTLNAKTPFQILVAVLLSAQTTDVAVNAVTPRLFAAYPDAAALAMATPAVIEPYIDRLGLYHNKAKYLVALSQALVTRYDGQVPESTKALVALPGVGPKTATVVRTDAFNIPGVAVDTHVSRIIRGFGIAPPNATPQAIQRRLEGLMPPATWINLHRALIRLGREWLTARNPKLPPGPAWAAFAADYKPVARKSKEGPTHA